MATLVDQDHDQKQTDLVETDKAAATTGSEHFELTQVDSVGNYVYADDDVEPALTWRTYVAFISLCIYQAAATTVVTATPSVLSYIAADLNGTAVQAWIPNALNVVPAALSPVLAQISDTFQIRKPLLVGGCAIAMIGAAVAPGSTGINRLIISQALIGCGFAVQGMGYAVPSEILPRKYRPLAQGLLQTWAYVGGILGSMSIGAMINNLGRGGWRKFYWLNMALWATSTLGILAAYRPPRRHTHLDDLTFWQKLKYVDIIGSFLFSGGLTLFLVGISLGGGQYTWTDAHTLGTLVVGLGVLLIFGIYEWRGTKIGILHHELFHGGASQGRLFSICIALIFVEGVLLFATALVYPIYVRSNITSNPLKVVSYLQPNYVVGSLSTAIYGYVATRLRSVRGPMLFGWVVWTGSMIGFATLQPNQPINALAFNGMAGLGFAAPLALIVAAVQLAVPHSHIAAASAVVASTRSVSGSVFTAIYIAALDERLEIRLSAYIATAAAKAGLAPDSVAPFVKALAGNDVAALAKIPGVTASIINAGVEALKRAFADSLRICFCIAAPFGVLACILTLFIGPLKKTMNYHIDAPVEHLHAKRDRRQEEQDTGKA